MIPNFTILVYICCSAVQWITVQALGSVPGSEYWLPWEIAVWPWVNYLASLGLCVPACKMGIITTLLVGLLWGLQESLLISSCQSSVGMSIGPSKYLLQVFIFSYFSTPTPLTFSETAFSSCKVNSAWKQYKDSLHVFNWSSCYS